MLERTPRAIDARFVRGPVRVTDVRVRPSGAQLTASVALDAELASPRPRVREIVDALDAFAFDLGPVLHDLHERPNASLSDRDATPTTAVRGRIETLRVDDLLLGEEVTVVASASGDLRSHLDAPGGT